MTKFIKLAKKKRKMSAQSNKFVKKVIKTKPTTFYVVVSLVVLIGLSYLVFVNKVATDGYQVKALSEQIEQLKDNHKKLELEAAGLQSLSNIHEIGETLELVSIDKMDYISATSTAVAYK